MPHVARSCNTLASAFLRQVTMAWYLRQVFPAMIVWTMHIRCLCKVCTLPTVTAQEFRNGHWPQHSGTRLAGLDTDLMLTVTHDLTFTVLAPAPGQQLEQVHSTQLNIHSAPNTLSMTNVVISQPVTVWKSTRESSRHSHIFYIALASHSMIWILDLRIAVCTSSLTCPAQAS